MVETVVMGASPSRVVPRAQGNYFVVCRVDPEGNTPLACDIPHPERADSDT
jgi:hypothetical protein